MTYLERQAIVVALTLLAEAIEDGNEHLVAGITAAEIRALAARAEAGAP